jgi:hypothetical protein
MRIGEKVRCGALSTAIHRIDLVAGNASLGRAVQAAPQRLRPRNDTAWQFAFPGDCHAIGGFRIGNRRIGAGAGQHGERGWLFHGHAALKKLPEYRGF